MHAVHLICRMLCRVLFYSVMVCYSMLFCVVLCSILCYLMIWYDILCVGNQTNIYFSYTSRGHDYGRPTGHQLVLADAAVAFAHVLQAGDPFIGTFAWQDVSTGLHCVKLIIGPNIQWSCSIRVQPSPHNWPKNSSWNALKCLKCDE